MNKLTRRGGLSALLLAAAALLLLAGCKKDERDSHDPEGHQAHDMRPAPAATGAMAEAGRLTPVAADKVCMVNDQVFPSGQIPVEVDGRTYYGCCEGCKATLANDPSARTAVDPISGRMVDKAVASIGALPDGRVYYFETDAHRDAFGTARTN